MDFLTFVGVSGTRHAINPESVVRLKIEPLYPPENDIQLLSIECKGDWGPPRTVKVTRATAAELWDELGGKPQ